MSRWLPSVVLVVSCGGASNAVDAGPYDAGTPSQHHRARRLGATDAGNGFFEYLPPRYEDGAPRPLLIFWHGFGENGNGGTELDRVLTWGPPKAIDADLWPLSRPFIVLSPQHASDTGDCPARDEVHAFVSWAIAAYHVDPKRVFLTGISCGAIGSWDYLGTYTDSQIAAAVLVAGDPGDPADAGSAWGRAGCGLGKVAIWAFHGTADQTVDIANEQATVDLLEPCPSRQELIWTPIGGGPHFIWEDVYDGGYGDVYGWLLAHPKS